MTTPAPSPCRACEVLDPNGGIVRGPNGLRVDPPTAGLTLVTAGDGVDVSGAGSGANPYVLDANEAEMISQSAGNALVINSGKLYVPAAAPTQVTGGDGVDVTGIGTTGNPFVLNANEAEMVSPAAQNTLSLNGGKLFVADRRFVADEARYLAVPTGGSNLADLAAADSAYHQLGPATPLTITNPSATLPMRVVVQCVVDHVALTTGDGPVVDVVFEARLAVSGAVTDAFNAHQIWRYDDAANTAGNMVFDTSGSQSTRVYTIPAGAAITLSLTAWINIRVNTTTSGNNVASNYLVQAVAWGGNS